MLFLSMMSAAASTWQPVVEASGIRPAYRAHAQKAGALGLATELACRDVGAGLEVCLIDEGTKRYVTLADKPDWDTVVSQALATAKTLPEAPVDEESPELGSYWVLSGALAGSSLLAPQVLPECAEGHLVFGFPARGEGLAWCSGKAERDKILAVAVRKAFEAADHQVSADLVRRTESGWEVWGTARMTAP